MTDDGTGDEWDEALDELFDESAPPESAPDSARKQVWDRLSESIDAERGGPDGATDQEADSETSTGDTEGAAVDSEPDSVGGAGDALAQSSWVRTAATFLVGATVGAGGYAVYDALTEEVESPETHDASVIRRDAGDTFPDDVAVSNAADTGIRRDANVDVDSVGETGMRDTADPESSSDTSQPPDRAGGSSDAPDQGDRDAASTGSEPGSAADTTKGSGNLSAERSILSRAQSALRGRRAQTALSALREHERRFPNGQLVEERRALTVRALHRSGQVDRARRRARSFLGDYPQSIFRGSVESVLRDLEETADVGGTSDGEAAGE